MTARVFLNGQWLPADEARVPVMDRGFLFGDGVYEVIPVYSRRPFRLEQHLARLQQSLDGIQLANPHGMSEWIASVTQLAAEAEWEDQSIYIQVTRGPMAVRNHAFPKEVRPTSVIFAESLITPPASQREQGIGAVSAADIRWLRCDLKTTSLLANCLLRQMAVAAGCVETVLFRDGFLTEGSASSIFVVKDGVLLAPIKNHLMLPGITYDVVLELAAQHGLPHEVRDITEAETRAADELWMCSSTKEVLPVVTLDGQRVGAGGTAGPLFAQMYAWYQEFKATVMRGGAMNKETLLEFPCDFPLKIMGPTTENFAQTIVAIVLRHAPDFNAASIEMRPSKAGNYLSLTCTVRAVSQAQLDALYRELTAHPMVKVVL